jgi:hypothetical protein
MTTSASLGSAGAAAASQRREPRSLYQPSGTPSPTSRQIERVDLPPKHFKLAFPFVHRLSVSKVQGAVFLFELVQFLQQSLAFGCLTTGFAEGSEGSSAL